MGTFEKAGKAKNGFKEIVIDIAEKIAVKVVDAIDVLQEMIIDMPQNAKRRKLMRQDKIK